MKVSLCIIHGSANKIGRLHWLDEPLPIWLPIDLAGKKKIRQRIFNSPGFGHNNEFFRDLIHTVLFFQLLGHFGFKKNK